MATYLPGMTDYIPQIQSFNPDLNFLGNVLQTKQTKYDAAHKQLSGLYGSILNAPMSREDNITKRDEMFKMIDNEIQRVSGLDLSLQQNIDVAKEVFDPIIDDKSIMKDMLWTRNYNDQVQRGEGFKMCTNAEKCGGEYWEPGMSELQYRRQEFMNASPEDALNFRDVSFTPNFNLMDDAITSLKDSGFEVKFDVSRGGYIYSNTNTKEMVGTLQDYLTAKYGSDQRVLDTFKTKSYVARKSWVDQNLDQFNGDTNAANNAYVKDLLARTTKEIEAEQKMAEKNHQNTTEMKNSLDDVAKSGVNKNDAYYIDAWNNANEAHKTTAASVEVSKDAGAAVKATSLNVGNQKVFDESFDRQVAYNMMYKELGNIAKVYQQLTQKSSMKADPYGVQAQGHANAMERLYMEKGYFSQQTGEWIPGLDAANFKFKEDVKQQIEKEKCNR